MIAEDGAIATKASCAATAPHGVDSHSGQGIVDDDAGDGAVAVAVGDCAVGSRGADVLHFPPRFRPTAMSQGAQPAVLSRGAVLPRGEESSRQMD